MTLLSVNAARVLVGTSRDLAGPHVLFTIAASADMGSKDLIYVRCQDLARLLHSGAEDPLFVKLTRSNPFEAFAVLVLLVQRFAGHNVQRFAVAEEVAAGRKRVAVEHIWPKAALMAARIAAPLLDHAAGIAEATEAKIREALKRYLEACAAGPSCPARYLLDEARRRSIPVTFLPPSNLRFGHGTRARVTQRLITDRTAFLAVRQATDKTVALALFAKAGFPVPRHLEVRDAASAVAFAEEIGFPVVVKPVTTDHGRGVSAGVMTSSATSEAYHYARRFGERVAVESFIPGETYRLLVVDGRFVAASRTEPTPITGDGRRTIRELIAAVNATSERGPDHLKPLSFIQLDEEANAILKALQLTPDSVLPAERTLRLRSSSNLSRGGLSVAVTDDVHPKNRKLAERAAKLIGLDIAGIDFRAIGIDRPWSETGGAIIEINPTPGLRMHFAPARGDKVDVAAPIFDMLFPGGGTGRIPIVAVTGTNGKTTVTRMIAHALRTAGYVTGRTTTEETAVDDVIIMHGDCAGPGPARRILSLRHVEAAVFETARGGLIKYGLGFERCDVAVVTNIEADHLGELGIATLEELARVKRVVAESADKAVVLNADDALCRAMRPYLSAESVVLFSMSNENAEIARHIEQGGAAYFLVGEAGVSAIWRALPSAVPEEYIPVEGLPVAIAGHARHNLQNAMAAIAALDALGVEANKIKQALSTFLPGGCTNPGRLQTIEGFPFSVMLDYGHNAHAFEAVANFVRGLNVEGKKICAVTMNGTRISDDTARQAVSALAPTFDSFVTFTSNAPKRRRAGLEDALRDGLIKAGASPDAVIALDGDHPAISAALEMAGPGDFVMVLSGNTSRDNYEIIASLRSQFSSPSGIPVAVKSAK